LDGNNAAMKRDGIKVDVYAAAMVVYTLTMTACFRFLKGISSQ